MRLFPTWNLRPLRNLPDATFRRELEENLRDLERLWNAQEEAHYQVLALGGDSVSAPGTLELFPTAFPLTPIAFTGYASGAGDVDVQIVYDDGSGATDLLVSDLNLTATNTVLNQQTDFTSQDVGVGYIALSCEAVATTAPFVRCLFYFQSDVQIRL